ncbi:MAG: fibronectin type III domain-containing protein [Ferruginibacter sp.]
MPEEVKIDVKKLGNSSLLYWKKPNSGAVKGYYLLVRETTEALWQKKVFTTATEITVPYSKDNYFFAVQSVNEIGNESLPAVPGIGR